MQTTIARRTATIVGAVAIMGGTVFTHAARAADSPGYEALKRSQLALLKCKSYRAIAKTTDESGKTTVRTLEVIPPKSYHIIMGSTMEMIILPEGSYTRRNGRWTRLPMDMSAMMSSVTNMTGDIAKEGAKHTTVKLVGPSVWHGTPAMLYSAVYADEDRQSNSKIWVRATNGLPLHSEGTVNSKKMTIGTKTIGGKSKTEVDYDYTTPVTITAPKTK